MADRNRLEHDIAIKAGQDVAAAIQRNMALVDTPEGMMKIAVSAASLAFATASGTCAAILDHSDGRQFIDSLWAAAVRPLALRAHGQPAEFEALLTSIGDMANG